MNFDQYTTFWVQMRSGELLRDGIEQSSDTAIGVNRQQGLIVLSRGLVADPSDAYKATEILLDDMRMNLTSMYSGNRGWEVSAASACLVESLDNINDYLREQHANQSTVFDNATGVSLCALQLMSDHFSVVTGDHYHCLLLRRGKAEIISAAQPSRQGIGMATDFAARAEEHGFEEGDLLVLMPAREMQVVGEDFVNVTLARFADHPEMALRQINARANRENLPHKPAMAIVSINRKVPKKQGWLGKFGKGK